MPPKKVASAPAQGGDGVATALCYMMMTCEDLKVDNNKLATLLGVAHGRNIPRKINSLINPHGFEFKGGKIIQSGSQAPVAAAGPNTKGLEPNRKARQRPASKKRKYAENSSDEDSSDRVKEEDGQGLDGVN